MQCSYCRLEQDGCLRGIKSGNRGILTYFLLETAPFFPPAWPSKLSLPIKNWAQNLVHCTRAQSAMIWLYCL